jgi:hypothetical protein
MTASLPAAPADAAGSSGGRPTIGAVTNHDPARLIGFANVRLWLGLFVISNVFEQVAGLAQNQHLSWPPSLYGPIIFATVWTGLGIAQKRYNAPRSR